ncbi:ATP-binding cassette domain-containing protein [Lichenicola sp.]|uniref:ATP-binding cassette domain-containing protein n=1 Tax=Lichenicola sp. TaxID=2804529 RepID=UPI003AFF9D8D
MRRVGVSHLVDPAYTLLSGGERQSVLIARALAQRAGILILDEPATGLDLGQQLRLSDIRRGLEAGCLVILSIARDPFRARNTVDRPVLLHRGRVLADGPASEPIASRRCGLSLGWKRIGACRLPGDRVPSGSRRFAWTSLRRRINVTRNGTQSPPTGDQQTTGRSGHDDRGNPEHQGTRHRPDRADGSGQRGRRTAGRAPDRCGAGDRCGRPAPQHDVA